MTLKIFYFALHLNAVFLVSFARPDCIPEIAVADSKALVEVVDVVKICQDGQFECRNGECIEDLFLCDGEADCSDQSDETRFECSKPKFSCSDSEFRCDYGACVNKDAVCNGVKDCLDNSDELLAECSKPAQQRELLIHVRINDAAVNDYVETHENLPRKEETKPRHRKIIYQVKRPIRYGKPVYANKIDNPEPTTSVSVLPLERSNYTLCVVPPQPPNGQWRLHSDFCHGKKDCDIPQNIALKPGSRLVYWCDTDFGIRGDADVYCGAGGSWSSIPECIGHVSVTTCPPLNSISRAATCSRDGERVSCQTSISPRTRAKVTCRVNYGLESNPVPTVIEQDIECNQDGRWEPEPITCRPICGLENPFSRKQETVNNVSIEAGGFPWHANLWREVNSGEKVDYEFRCSATIVRPNFVLTAAYCVVSDISGVSENPERLRVTAGNVYRDINDLETASWIVQKVKNVYRNCGNMSFFLDDVSDIALIELSEPFQFSTQILPVCLDDSWRSEAIFESGGTGKIDGFGINSVTASSPVLQIANVSYALNNECRMPYNDSGIEVIIKNDEFCGAYSNETTVCDWDTGGGLVVQKSGLWHLVGIYSAGLRPSLVDAPSTNCGDNPYSLYTKVSAYIPWIQDVFFKLERYKSYPVCSFYIPPQIQLQQNIIKPIRPASSPSNAGNPIRPASAPSNAGNPIRPASSLRNAGNSITSAPSSPNAGNPITPVPLLPNAANPITSAPSPPNAANPITPVPSPPNAGNPITPTPSLPNAGNSITPSPSLPNAGNSITPTPSPPNAGNPITPTPSLPNAGNSITPTPSPPNAGNPITPTPSLPNAANPMTPTPSLPNAGNSITPAPSPNPITSVRPSPSPAKSPMMMTMMMPNPDLVKTQIPQYAQSVSCAIPPQPTNGNYKSHSSLCGGKTDCTLPEGAALKPGSQLVYSCLPGFRINGSADVFCGLNGNWSAIPTCTAITCPSLDSASTIMSCFRSNRYKRCNSTELPDTTAVLQCRPAYTEDASLAMAGNKHVKCNANGQWEPKPISCLPMCGITNTQFTPTVLRGHSAKISQFPWHATLYKQEKPPDGPKMFQCGGTIIQNNLVLTAAHCVYDDKFKTVELPGKFYVVTGNVFQDYDSSFHDQRVVQKAMVKSIHVPCEYFGLNGNYNSDIAIIELRGSFQLSGILIPACMDVVGNNEQLLEPGSIAKIAGFGGTESSVTSASLLTTNISYVSYSECKMADSTQENVGLISNDKFCGKGQNGAAVCQGDSGGGLVFQSDGRWHVMGVLSVNLGASTLNGEKTCIPNSYALYTKVLTYMSWIRSVMNSLQKFEAYTSCEFDTNTIT
ncbi:uncharacterized protein LOC124413662 [Diprion similis]|uniref:uncharacterized protein LOC124413662 n=1 Tax=Diprion similis TaxID=362088 RepID=UPI001EF80948|nr:uncharacterized protein LOC124413662 [Diprion similis]